MCHGFSSKHCTGTVVVGLTPSNWYRVGVATMIFQSFTKLNCEFVFICIVASLKAKLLDEFPCLWVFFSRLGLSHVSGVDVFHVWRFVSAAITWARIHPSSVIHLRRYGPWALQSMIHALDLGLDMFYSILLPRARRRRRPPLLKRPRFMMMMAALPEQHNGKGMELEHAR